MSVSVFLLLLSLLQASEKLGLPGLIENTRYAIYLAYGTGVAWSLIADSILFLLFQEKRLIHLGGLVFLVASWVVLGIIWCSSLAEHMVQVEPFPFSRRILVTQAMASFVS